LFHQLVNVKGQRGNVGTNLLNFLYWQLGLDLVDVGLENRGDCVHGGFLSGVAVRVCACVWLVWFNDPSYLGLW
jgi:hypothetical protein